MGLLVVDYCREQLIAPAIQVARRNRAHSNAYALGRCLPHYAELPASLVVRGG